MQTHIDPRAERFAKVIAFAGLLISLSVGFVIAEPWISNRYAQNCAGCHAPGRVNRPPIGRRCSLSCQGCHVNPQGGGLRNQYGKWNSQRWLRSFRSKYIHDEATPAPLEEQVYNKRVEYLAKGKKLPKKVTKRIPPHKTTADIDPPSSQFDKYSWDAWMTDVESDEQFGAIIPKDDPWRLEREMPHYAGADFRYFWGSFQRSTTNVEREFNGFMAVDVALRMRPIKNYHKISFVVESRIQDPADSYILDTLDSQQGYLRSAYVLWDDLPFNTYAQFGNTRPLFGNYSVNHETLAQQLMGFGNRPTFRTFSVGGSPNIPYFTANYIMKSNAQGQSNDVDLGSGDEGYALQLGGRWVTLGLSGSISVWSTGRDVGGQRRTWDMFAVTGGTALFDSRLILNAESTRIDRQRTTSEGTDGGNVHTLEAKYRFWREFYLQGSYAQANVLSNQGSAVANLANSALPDSMAPGEATEIGYGLKAFLVSGLELDLLFLDREETPDQAGADNFSSELMMLQLHAYF